MCNTRLCPAGKHPLRLAAQIKFKDSVWLGVANKDISSDNCKGNTHRCQVGEAAGRSIEGFEIYMVLGEMSETAKNSGVKL